MKMKKKEKIEWNDWSSINDLIFSIDVNFPNNPGFLGERKNQKKNKSCCKCSKKLIDSINFFDHLI